MSTPHGQPTQEQLDELVRRIVEAVHPLRIILFASRAPCKYSLRHSSASPRL
jgi:hypothetical protein